MRPVAISPLMPGATAEQKLDWCVRMIGEIARASRDADPNTYADGFTITNLTHSRSLDCDTATLADLADVVGTLIRDHQTRGAKRT